MDKKKKKRENLKTKLKIFLGHRGLLFLSKYSNMIGKRVTADIKFLGLSYQLKILMLCFNFQHAITATNL